MLELVEPLLQADLLHLQQGAVLDFIQREAVLFSKVIDQWVLRVGQALRRAGAQLPAQASASLCPHLTTCLRVLASPSPIQWDLYIPIPMRL